MIDLQDILELTRSKSQLPKSITSQSFTMRLKRCNMYLTPKSICYKLYKELQLLLVSTYYQKNLLIDYTTNLLQFTNQKNKNYDSILVIVNYLTKIVDYKPVKVTIYTLRVAKVIINMVMQYHGFLNSIISDCRAIFMSKFCFLLYYFLDIKRQLSTIFQSQIDR